MNPIIKWPGGKTREIRQIQGIIPHFHRYLEPFFGGGALFFHLEPQLAAINDISAELISFYRLAQAGDGELKRLLLAYAGSFEQTIAFCAGRTGALVRIFEGLRGGGIPPEGLLAELEGLVLELTDGLVRGYGDSLAIDEAALAGELLRMASDKLFRTVENHRKRPFNDGDLRENLVTGFLSGYYMYFRNVFNDLALGRMEAPAQYRAANFYFIREYCYGSMFRYNARGEFNIPYGGMSYNRKNIRAKIDAVFSAGVGRLLNNAEIHCLDFEEFLREVSPRRGDFMFLDPPYDTDFSDYEGRDFTRLDQERLARALRETPADFILVIKDTDFIRGLYADGFNVLGFDNRYTYNVRSRNERSARHLVITNMDA